MLSSHKKLTIKSRLIFIICFLAITLLGIGSIAMFGMNSAKDSLRTIYDDRLLALDQLTSIESLILQNRIAITASLVTPTPDFISLNIAKVEKNIAQIEKIWEAYMATYFTPEEKILAAKFVDDRNKLITQGLNPAVAALRANDINKVSRIIVENIRPLYEPVGNGIKTLGQLQLTVAKQVYDEIRRRYDIIRNTIIATAILGLGLAIWIGFLLVRAISRPLEEAVRIARVVAAGDLTQKIEVRSTNEIGQLMKALKEIHDSLVKMIDQGRSREMQIRTILDAAPDAVVSMDIYGLVMDWNPQAERIFGYSRAEAAGKLLSNLIIPPLVRDTHKHGLEHFLKTGEGPLLSKRIEVTAMRADGSEFPIELAIVLIQSGDVLFFNAFIRDITSRKKAERELTRLGRVLDESSNEIYVFDAQTLRFTMVNAGAQRNLG